MLSALLLLLPLALPATTRTLRYENIRDDEVREIQGVMAKIEPGAIVDIDSVYDGCSCAEGPKCTSQVWVVSHRDGRDNGIWLSKIESHWSLGPWEQWERDWHALQGRRYQIIGTAGPGYEERRRQYYQRVEQLEGMKPVCPGAASPEADSRPPGALQLCARNAASCARR